MASSSLIRVETFHPILASWALCGFERAPVRVKEWIKQLTALGETKPHLKPDLNTQQAIILSWRNVQDAIISKTELSRLLTLSDGSGESSSQSAKSKMLRDSLFTGAQHCMQHLMEVFPEEYKCQDSAAMVSMLKNTVETWGRAVSYDPSHGVHELLEIARLFDSLINAGEVDEGRARNTLRLMGETYAEIISQFHQIDSAPSSDGATTCFMSSELPAVEKMVRDFDFYSRKHFPQGNSTSDSKATRHRLHRELLRACGGLKSPADHGHAVRLCRLVMDQLSWQNEQCHNSADGRAKEDITDIYVDIALLTGTVVESPHERTFVLTVVWNNARPFFEKKWHYDATSSYATVDRSILIGAMRTAMGEGELTEVFIQTFEERPPQRRARGNTWMSFVEDLLRGKKKRNSAIRKD